MTSGSLSRFLLFGLLVTLSGTSTLAQGYDPYQRVSDPRAIAVLTLPDSLPLRSTMGIAYSLNRDTDGYQILAQDSGAGVISHIWFQWYRLTDASGDMKLWVDDSLVVQCPVLSFFRDERGPLGGQLDTLQSGGLVCDVQITYRRNFKISFREAKTSGLFWTIEWRPIVDSNLVESFRLDPSPTYQAQQQAAEQFVERHRLGLRKSHLFGTKLSSYTQATRCLRQMSLALPWGRNSRSKPIRMRWRRFEDWWWRCSGMDTQTRA